MGLTSALTACAASEYDTSAANIAIEGPWVPPAATLALSNPQQVMVSEPPMVTGQCNSTCPADARGAFGLCVDPGCSGLKPGTRDLQLYIQRRWNFVGAGGNYNCRRNSNQSVNGFGVRSCTNLSVHSVGRAVDLMIPQASGGADNTNGDQVANWLIENAEYIGIQRVIWDGKYWNGGRINNHFSDIPNGVDHHTNHIHAELSVEGADRRTRFFTIGPPPVTCPVTCYGNLAVRADCTFVDCAAMGQVCTGDPPRCAAGERPESVRNPAVTIPAAVLTGGLVRFQPVAPTRLFDTRMPAASALLRRSDGAMAGPLGPMREGTISTFAGLPAGAVGVWLNAAAVPLMAPGFVSVFPAGAATTSSLINYAPPLSRANAVAVALGAGGGVTFTASSDSDVIADMSGAFAPTGMGLRAVTPTRVLDTRASAPAMANTRRVLMLNPPMEARSVVASVAVIPRGNAGFLQVFACDAMPPATSTINYGASAVVSNAVISTITGGQICVQASSDADVIVDVTGYLVDTGELSLQLVRPLRLIDTRDMGSLYAGRVGPGQVIELPIAAIPGLPADARAAIVNLTSVDALANGFFTAYPCGISTPNTSNLNYQAGTVGASTVVAALGGGRLCVYSNTRSHVIADLYGVWVPTPGSTPSTMLPPEMEVPEDPNMLEQDAGAMSDATAPTGDAQSNGDAGAMGRDGSTVPPANAGCGCRTAPTQSPVRPLAMWTAAALVVLLRRRRHQERA
jgi:MYXO-CTERM domain-containing protein